MKHTWEILNNEEYFIFSEIESAIDSGNIKYINKIDNEKFLNKLKEKYKAKKEFCIYLDELIENMNRIIL